MAAPSGYLEETPCLKCGRPGVFFAKDDTSVHNFIHRERDDMMRCRMTRGKDAKTPEELDD